MALILDSTETTFGPTDPWLHAATEPFPNHTESIYTSQSHYEINKLNFKTDILDQAVAFSQQHLPSVSVR